MQSSYSTNIADYTLAELMGILEINEINPTEIKKITNNYYEKYKYEDPNLAIFFKNIQSNLLQYANYLTENTTTHETQNKIIVEGFTSNNSQNDAIYPPGEKQVTDWYENEALTQTDENQTNKITDRKQKIDVFGNEQVPMKREQIATTDTFQLPVKQDSLNPNLKNTITRFINIDSQFRQYTNGVDSGSTNFTLDLSDSLKDVLSIRLYSYQIPYTWYTIDDAYGNTCLWIIETDIIIPVSIAPGNYSPAEFVTILNQSFQTAGFIDSSNNIVSYNANNGLITLSLFGISYSDPVYGTSFICSGETIIQFYDFTGGLKCSGEKCQTKTNHFFNGTLGWLMGYRLPYINVIENGNVAPAILNLSGPKYLLLSIDDYNQNHVNNSLVSIAQLSNRLKMPEYYTPDIPRTCISANEKGNNLTEIIRQSKTQSLFDLQTTNPLNGLLIAGKYEQDYTPTEIVLPSAPRTLTQAQLYTINQINNNDNNLTNYLAKAPTSSDILATLPIKTSGINTGTLLVEFSSSLQNNIRTYFGPINIERMSVQLMDDKGNLLNLNGGDWCITLICDCLYQY